MNFTHYTCANGVATPKNPYPLFINSKICSNDIQTNDEKWLEFDKWSKANTVSCSEDLSGEYSVELFKEPVFQTVINGNWCGHMPVGTYSEYERYATIHNKTRKYLSLKNETAYILEPEVKQELGELEELRKFADLVRYMSEETGRSGCNYGDTDYDSESVCYGHNQLLEYLKSKLPSPPKSI